MKSTFLAKMLASHAAALSIDVACSGLHALRVTAATNALKCEDIAITRICDRRKIRPEEHPSFKVIC
jgi:hypothetical protein